MNPKYGKALSLILVSASLVGVLHGSLFVAVLWVAIFSTFYIGALWIRQTETKPQSS